MGCQNLIPVLYALVAESHASRVPRYQMLEIHAPFPAELMRLPMVYISEVLVVTASLAYSGLGDQVLCRPLERMDRLSRISIILAMLGKGATHLTHTMGSG